MIKSEEHLANLLGRAFATYANHVENGAVNPYKKLLSEDVVEVVFTVTENGIVSVKEIINEIFVVSEEMPLETQEEEKPVEDTDTFST